MSRYEKNIGTLTEAGQKKINESKVLVIGSGGLGGFVIEGLARMGIKTIGVCDFDVFDNTNLNRQLFSSLEVLGQKKAEVAKKRILSIDDTIEVLTYTEAFPNDDIIADIDRFDLVVDCLDSMKVRKILSKFCIENKKLLIHGAVGGYYGTLAVIDEDNQIIDKLIDLNGGSDDTIEKRMGNPYAIVATISALQVHLAIQVLLERKYLKKGMYYVDIQSFNIDEIVF